MVKKIITLSLLFAIFLPQVTYAGDFNPNFVITDAEATETSSFNANDIQLFLGARGSGLYSYLTPDYDGTLRPVGEIIYGASIRNKVSPRFLLALLQREQSLITDPHPSQKALDWATGYGVCDSCSMDDPALEKYKGFAKQVESAAANFRFFMDNGKNLTGFRKINVPAVIDGVEIIPATNATANLYNYTPHIHAQKNFWQIWQKYFVRRYPSGSLVTAEPDIAGTWLIKYGERRKIMSNSILLSRFNLNKIIKVSANELISYSIGTPIKFANYSLLRSPGGTVYLIVDDERRGISSQEVFRRLGFNKSEVENATWEDLNAYKEGKAITLASAYPFGALLQDPKSGGIYFVQNGNKHPLLGKELLSLYFKNRKVKLSTLEELKSITLADPVNLQDGELVKTPESTSIYVIADGKRLPIISAEQFEKQGWKWENIKTVSEKVLALSPLGDAFDALGDNTTPSNE